MLPVRLLVLLLTPAAVYALISPSSYLLFHCLITILEMASLALCIMYIPHLSDTFPLGSLLCIPCSFNVLPQNLTCCLDSFRERRHAQNLLRLSMHILDTAARR